MILGILLWIVSALAGVLLAFGVTRALRWSVLRLDILQWIFWWLFIQTGTVLLLGSIGLLAPLPLALAGLVAATVVVSFSPQMADELRMLIRSVFAQLQEFARTHPVAFGLVLLAVVLASIRSAFYIWVLPPHVYDVLTYHLPKVADWIQEQRLVALPTSVKRSFWPAGFELLQAWFVIFLHHDVVIEAAGLPFLALAVGSVYCMARSFGLPSRYAALCSVAYLLTPVVLQNAVSCKNDLPVAGLFLFCVAVLLEWRQRPQLTIAAATMLISALAFATGIKPYILFMAPASALWCLLAERPPIRQLRTALMRRYPPSLILLLCLCAAGLGLYFYIRNAVVFGNPFHPTDFRLFGRLVAGDGHGMGQQGSFSISSLKASLVHTLGSRIFDPQPFSPDVGNSAGWGYFCFAVGIPGLLTSCIVNRRFAAAAAMFAAAFCTVLAFVNFDAWNLRFMQWMPAIFCIGFGVALQSIRSADIRRAAVVLACLCLALNFIGSINNGWFKRPDWRNALRQPRQRKVAATGYGRVWPLIPPGETLAYRMNGNAPLYVLYGPDFRNRVRYLVVDSAAPEYAPAMRCLGARYLYFAPDLRGPQRNAFDRELAAGLFRPVKSGLFLLANPEEKP